MGRTTTARTSALTTALTTGLATLAVAPVLIVAGAADAFAAPNPKPNLPGDVQAKLDTLLGMGMAAVIVACVAGVFVCAGKLALSLRHGEGAQAAGQLIAVLVACVLVGSGAGIVNYLI